MAHHSFSCMFQVVLNSSGYTESWLDDFINKCKTTQLENAIKTNLEHVVDLIVILNAVQQWPLVKFLLFTVVHLQLLERNCFCNKSVCLNIWLSTI